MWYVSLWRYVSNALANLFNITIDITTSNGESIKQSGIVAFVYDDEALGIMFDEPRQDVYVDVNHDVNHVMYKGTQGYFNDFGENAVVFYIAEDDADAGEGN